jgi:GR25 family glycosyltransferase involved in LPS biosynthesis
MNKINKIYYINLDRRQDRKEHFEAQCKKEKVSMDKVVRYQALDGNTYNFSEEQTKMFSRCDFLGKPFEKKIMGNQLSHYNILKDMVDNKYEYIIILQDDVMFKTGFNKRLDKVMNSIPEDAEIINIGFHKYAAYDKFIPWDLNTSNDYKEIGKTKINEEICILQDTINPCSLGYIVTLKGAINLLNFFNKYGFFRATDWNYNDYLRMKNIFYGTTTVLCTGNPNLGSDIFT